jgi:outer membrane protein TolC
VARANLKSAEEILSVVQRRVTAGIPPMPILIQQRAALAAQQATVPALEQQELEARNALAILLGRPPEGFAVTGEGLGALAPARSGAGTSFRTFGEASRNHGGGGQSVAAHADLEAARTAYFPSISLTAMVVSPIRRWRRRSTPARRGSGSRRRHQPAQVIFDGGRTERQDRGSRAREEELLAAYRAAVIASFSDVENALGSFAHLGAQKRPCASRRHRRRRC